MKQILLTMIALSGILLADFTRSGDIVTDTATELAWQDDAAAATYTADWQGAIDHCEALELGGYTDWRLPNKQELLSIIDRSRYSPAIDTTVFAHMVSGYYWSSTTGAPYTYNAWLVNFNGGYSFNGNKTAYLSVRCVRSL